MAAMAAMATKPLISPIYAEIQPGESPHVRDEGPVEPDG
jgi:hypothetical protein